MDHNEFCCVFDTSQYTGTPDAAPCPHAVNVPPLIQDYDGLCETGRGTEALALLLDARDTARRAGDWRGELSVVSELLGHYRRTGEADKGLAAVNDALALVKEHRMGRTTSGATVLLNAATTLKAFGRAEESIPIFAHVARVYADEFDPLDYRFAGLYNNMALSYADVGDTDSAERYFKLAMKILEKLDGQEDDRAVTWCNLAELYGKRDMEDPRIDECLEKAWACLNAPDLPHGPYHAFTLSKCIPAFDYFGYFLYAKALRERMGEIHAGT